MKACWSEGDLRALLDGELPQEQAAAAERHVSECSACGTIYRELGARAAQVAALMGALSEESAPTVPVRRGAFGRPAKWAVTVAALAAALAFAMILSRRAPEQEVRATYVAPSPARPDVEAPSPAPAPPVVAVSAPERTAPERVHRLPSRPLRATPAQYYMALDEEPIDTGLVMRVALPSGALADVIVDGDGRARAIRPVSTVKEER